MQALDPPKRTCRSIQVRMFSFDTRRFMVAPFSSAPGVFYSVRPVLWLDSRAQLRLESSLQNVHHHHFIAPLPFRLFEAYTHTRRKFGTKSRAVATSVEPPIILPAVTTD